MGSRIRYPLLLALIWAGGATSVWGAQQTLVPEASLSKKGSAHPSGATVVRAPRQLAFIENRGQFDANVRFQAKSGGKVLWFTNAGLVFDVLRLAANSKGADAHSKRLLASLPTVFPRRMEGQPTLAGRELDRLAFSEHFDDGRISPKIEALAAQQGVYNYFIGNDSKNWRTGAVGYSELVYRDVWPGIDVRFVAKGADVEQEFLVYPGADASRIRISYRGTDGLQVSEGGSLVVETAFGPFRESAPQIYQGNHGGRASVPGSFKIMGDFTYAFQLGSYRRAKTLVIDPTLLFSTYIGGTGTDVGEAIAVDPAGNTYIGGLSQGGVYPTSVGVLQSSCPSAPCTSAVVTKLNPLGSLSYSTYLGSTTTAGAGGDSARGIAVDANGEAYVAGVANSGFPTTPNAFQAGCGVSSFVAKLNATGTALLYSSCLGSEGNGAGAFGVALDASGRAYVTGMTRNNGFPTTSNAFQLTLIGNTSAFLSVIDPSLSGAASLVYSTHLGGELDDSGNAIAVDAYGSAYITGNTISSHFPVTANSFQQTNRQAACFGDGTQCNTAFVAKLNPNFAGTSGLIYSSYLGGNVGSNGGKNSVGDYGYAIAVDSSGNAYVAGTTNSSNFPTTSGAFQKSTNCGDTGFVAKINAGGSALVYSTFLGPIASDCSGTGVSGVALDSSANVYITGSTSSTSFQVTTNAFQSGHHHGGAFNSDAFLAELAASGSSLVYSSYLGGSGDDFATSVAVDATGDAYVTGSTDSPDFPVTAFAFQPVFSGGPTTCLTSFFEPCPDAFIAKFPLGAPGGLSITGILPTVGGNGGTVSPQIIGMGFHAGATAQLNCGGQSVTGANLIVGTGGRLLNTTFNLTAALAGACDVVVTDPDGTSAKLAQAFAVQTGGAPQVWVDAVGWNFLHAGANQIYGIEFGNRGTVDSPLTRIWVAFPNYLQWQASGQSPSSAGQQNGTTYLAFDVAPVAGSTLEIPIGLTAPDSPIYAHQNFQVQVWMDAK